MAGLLGLILGRGYADILIDLKHEMYFEPFSSKEMETRNGIPVWRNKKLLQRQRERCHGAYGEGPHMNMSSQLPQSQMLCGLDSSRQREIIIGNRHGD